MDYLHLYGLRFNMDSVGISSRWGGMYFEKESIGILSLLAVLVQLLQEREAS